MACNLLPTNPTDQRHSHPTYASGGGYSARSCLTAFRRPAQEALAPRLPIYGPATRPSLLAYRPSSRVSRAS
eukprot:6287741-Alexandrium_andersonii.AAC.1